MSDRNNDILRRIIQNDPSRMGGVYRPGQIGSRTAERTGLTVDGTPARPQDFGGREGAPPTVVPGFGRDAFTAPIDTGGPTTTIPQIMAPVGGALQRVMSPAPDIDTPEFRQLEQVNPDTAAQLRRRAEAAAMPPPPGAANAGMPNVDRDVPPPPEGGPQPYAGQGLLPQHPDIMFAGADAGAEAPPVPQTPAERAQAGLLAARRGEDISIDPMSPEQFDPETGERSDEARKLGLLERMFGEQGSPEYRAAGRALMMAGAAIMTTDGNLGEALGNGIQAGLMQYDDVLTALREEEAEARAMGMAEEAHALNMQLKKIQIANAGRRGSLKGKAAEPELTPIQKGLVLADQLVGFGYSQDEAMRWGAQQAFGLPVGAGRVPAEDPFSFALGQ